MCWFFINLAALRSSNLSTFTPLGRSRTRTVESSSRKSSWKSDCCSCKLGSTSKTSEKLLTTFDFTVLGSFPTCLTSHPSSLTVTCSERIRFPKAQTYLLSRVFVCSLAAVHFVRISCSIWQFPHDRQFMILCSLLQLFKKICKKSTITNTKPQNMR